MKDEALDLALEALENSVDLVREDAYNAEKLYGNYPSRQGKVAGLKVLADDHEKAITAIKQARSAPVQENTMIYKTFEQWKSGNVLEHGVPRTEHYSEDQLDLVEMGWHYGYDAGRAVEQALDKKADNARELGLDYEPVPENFMDALKFDVAMRDAAPVQEPVAWPDGLIDRIKAAEQRIEDGHAPRRIPADPTDVDLVLAEVRYLLEGKQPPFWIDTTPPAQQDAKRYRYLYDLTCRVGVDSELVRRLTYNQAHLDALIEDTETARSSKENT